MCTILFICIGSSCEDWDDFYYMDEYRVHVTFKKALLMICCLEHCTILETKVYLSLGV